MQPVRQRKRKGRIGSLPHSLLHVESIQIALLRTQVNLCNLGVRLTRADSKCLLKHDRCWSRPRALGVVISQRVPHLMRDHILPILHQRQPALGGSPYPAIGIEPDVVSSQHGTRQLIFYTSGFLEPALTRQSDQLRGAGCSILEPVPPCPPLGVVEIDRDLFPKRLGWVGNVRVHLRSKPNGLHCLEPQVFPGRDEG